MTKPKTKKPTVEHTPHYRYPDWPGHTKITFEQGYAELENEHTGQFLYLKANVGMTLAESKFLREQLDHAITEQEELLKEAESLTDID